MQELLVEIIQETRSIGINHIDARYVKDYYEIFNAKNGNPERLSESYRSGVGFRVFFNNYMGFASTNNLEKSSLKKTVKMALKIAKLTEGKTKKKKIFQEEKEVHDKYITPTKIDPFSVDIEEKIIPLLECTKLLAEKDAQIRNATASMMNRKYSTLYISSEGSIIDQILIQCGGSITGMLMAGPGGMFVRTAENYRAQGLEFIEEFDLIEQAETIGNDLVVLREKAITVPNGNYNLILEPSHLGLVIHESIGHPTELDRILGREADFAGTSFIEKDYLENSFRYGSELVNIIHDPTLTPALGTYGYDDEATKAHRINIVDHGILSAFQSGRSTASEIGIELISGNARAHGHDRVPIDRMANLYFDPDPKLALSNFDELVMESKKGIYAMYSKTHSIAPNRSNFQFTTQMGYLIENGELTKPLKSIVYGSRTLDFWKNCVATTKDVIIYGTPNCGKGNPGQTIWTSHGGPYSLFKNVRIGV